MLRIKLCKIKAVTRFSRVYFEAVSPRLARVSPGNSRPQHPKKKNGPDLSDRGRMASLLNGLLIIVVVGGQLDVVEQYPSLSRERFPLRH
jgi:hypothetical protein